METATLLCHNLATQKGLDIGWFVDPSLPPVLCIDSMRVQQCLLNLLSNAIKFTKSAVRGWDGGGWMCFTREFLLLTSPCRFSF